MFKWLKRLFILSCVLFGLLNFVIYNHAYHLTHFVDKDIPKLKTEDVAQKSTWEKIKLGVMGTELPKQKNTTTPDSSFETIRIGEQPQLNCWWMPSTQKAKGVVLLFHGYNSNKSSMINRANLLLKLGYHTLLVDFRGHGDSEGHETSIGFHEANDVSTAYQYIKTYYPDLPVVLMGTSMGAVSILHAVSHNNIKASKLIIECPFESMRTAVESRLQKLNLPTPLLSDLLLFWGGWHNNMDCSKHDASMYASTVETPTLFIYGKKDPKVSMEETKHVYNALNGPKKLVIIEEAAHDQLMEDDPQSWTKAVWSFLEE